MTLSTPRRAIAAILSFALVLTAPGLPAYAAAGQVRADAAAGRPAGAMVAAPMPALNLNLGMTPAASASALRAPVSLPALPSAAAANVPSAAAAAAAPAARAAVATPSAASNLPSAAARKAATYQHVPEPVENSGIPSAAAAQTAAPSVTALSAARHAASAAAPRAAAAPILNAAFDGSVTRAAGSDSVAGSNGAGLSALSAPNGASQASRDNGGVPPSAPNGSGDGGGPQGPRKTSLWVVLGLGAVGGAAAWYFGPAAAAWLASHVPYVTGHPVAARAAVASIGALAGIAASQRQTWSGFPGAVRDASVRSASATFRFWGRFGMIFDAVLRGKPSDGAMKAELPANILRYPAAAWPFILVGYVCAPIAFTLGFLYKGLETPVLAALRGLKQVALDFFPWLADVLRLIKRVALKLFPFLGGMVWGAIRGEGIAIGVGAFALAAPLFKDVVAADYRASTLPGWIVIRVTQLAAIVGGAAAGLLGGVAGLFAGVPFALTESARMALRWARADGKALSALERWRLAIEAMDDPFLFVSLPFRSGEIGAGQGVTRALNLAPAAVFLAPYLLVSGLALYVRAWRGERGANAEGDESAKIEEREGAAPAGESYLAGVARSAADTAKTSWSLWRSVGKAADASVRGRAVAQGEKAWLGAPAALPGAVAAGGGYLAGGLIQAVAVPARFAWTRFVVIVRKFWPALKRVLDFALKAVKRAIPFAFGLLIGTIDGLIKGGVSGAAYFAAPFGELFDYAGGLPDREQSRFAERTSMVLIALPALAAVVTGFVAGVIAGIPAALTQGAARAVDWAGTGERSEKWAGSWFRALKIQAGLVGAMSEGAGRAAGKGDGTAVRVLTGGLNAALAAPVSALSLLLLWAANYGRALGLSAKIARGEKIDDAYRNADRDETEPAQTAEKPWKAGPVWLVAGVTLAAMGAAVFAPAYLPLLAALAGWKLWLATAGTVLLAGMAGLALTQPSFWLDLPVRLSRDGKAGAGATWSFWSRLGDGFAGGLLGREAKGSFLGYGHRAAGALLALAFAVLGAAVSLATLSVRAAAFGATQVVENLLPFMRGVLRTLLRIARRILPFVGGLFGGLVTGVVGSALFGALLLGRPYFKQVVAVDFQTGSLSQALGNLALKGVAAALGIVFGVVGLLAGVLAALPYAITLVPSMGFQLAEIGGNGQRFFDLWSKGALRVELRRINMLTDRFEFPQNGTPALVDGWIRLANIVPATIAAAVAATVAGYVAYFRSLRNAWRDLKAGKQAAGGDFDDMSSVGRSISKGASTGGKAGRRLVQWGGVIAVVGMAAFGHMALGKALWLFPTALLGGWLAGWIAGAVLGAFAGLFFGLLSWLADQLEKDPAK